MSPLSFNLSRFAEMLKQSQQNLRTGVSFHLLASEKVRFSNSEDGSKQIFLPNFLSQCIVNIIIFL